MTERQQYTTLRGLENWSKCYLITDSLLLSLPFDLIKQLSRHLQERWINLSKLYYSK